MSVLSIPSFCALLAAYETETSFLRSKLKEANSQLQEHEKLSQAKSVELEQMKESLGEKATSLSGMHVKYPCTGNSYHTVYHLW